MHVAPAAPGPGPDAPAARERPGPALAVGLAVGALLAVMNVYMGLKTGWWDPGSITASIVSFPLLSALARRRGGPSPLDTNLAQTTAAAVGAAPAAAGLLGAVPALAQGGRAIPGVLLAGWGLALGVLGVLLALALRRRLVEEERLPFPTGVATAQVIRGVHGGASGAAPALAAAATASAGFAALRDLAGRIPAVTALPGTLAGLPAGAFGLGFAWSPMMLGAGLVAGPRSGLGALGGAAVAWGIVAPALVRAGVVREASYPSLVAWLAWPGVALMLGSTAVALAAQGRAFRGAPRDLAALSGGRRAALLAALAVALAVAAGAAAFELRPWQAALALALAVPLAAVCGRAAGQTDIAPMGELGQLAQAAAGMLPGVSPVAGVGVGSVAAGASAHTAIGLWSLKAGAELGHAPRRQAAGLLVGAAAGAAVAVPVYALLVRAHGVGGEVFPAPGAAPWRALAEAAAGLGAIPPGAAAAATVALAAGALLELAARTRLGARLPSPGAFGMGFILPASYAAAIAAGALAGAAWRRFRPGSAELAPVVGGGAIAGESLAGVVAAAVTTLRS